MNLLNPFNIANSDSRFASGMYRDMLRNTVPRSIRAGIALVVMLAFLGVAVTMLPVLFVSSHVSASFVLKFVISLAIGLPAMVTFYYFQGLDSNPATKEYEPLETLNKAEEVRLEEERLKQVSATPAFPELDQTSETDHPETDHPETDHKL